MISRVLQKDPKNIPTLESRYQFRNPRRVNETEKIPKRFESWNQDTKIGINEPTNQASLPGLWNPRGANDTEKIRKRFQLWNQDTKIGITATLQKSANNEQIHQGALELIYWKLPIWCQKDPKKIPNVESRYQYWNPTLILIYSKEKVNNEQIHQGALELFYCIKSWIKYDSKKLEISNKNGIFPFHPPHFLTFQQPYPHFPPNTADTFRQTLQPLSAKH